MENVGEGVMAATVHEESLNLDEAMDSPLLGVPEEVLLHICHYLPASDLVRLGWTCHRLRVVCRSPFAWGRARIGPQFYPLGRRHLNMNGVLRIAPALHTLALSGDAWPRVDLLCCTRIVKVLVFYFAQRYNETREKDQLYRTILHYRHYLEKVDLSWCHDMKIFRLVDGLKKIRELCVTGSLVKTYPGSRTTVSALELGHRVSADIAAEIIQANRKNLTSFTAHSLSWGHSWVSESPAVSAVWRELGLCTGLHEASIPMFRDVSNIDSFPQLHTLTIRRLNAQAHSLIERVFEASQVMRGLRKLILEMGLYAHRGLIKVVASSCTSLRELHLLYDSTFDSMVKVPRDLHVILGHIGDLESLTLSGVRVPSTVFRGMAAGALPRLTEVHLECSAVTQRGHDALEAMRTRRPDLQVILGEEQNGSLVSVQRCAETICQDRSDCSEDPSDDEFMEDLDWEENWDVDEEGEEEGWEEEEMNEEEGEWEEEEGELDEEGAWEEEEAELDGEEAELDEEEGEWDGEYGEWDEEGEWNEEDVVLDEEEFDWEGEEGDDAYDADYALHGDDDMYGEDDIPGDDGMQAYDDIHGDDVIQGDDDLHGDDDFHGDNVVQGDDYFQGDDVIQGYDDIHDENVIYGDDDIQGDDDVQDYEDAWGYDDIQADDDAFGYQDAYDF